MKIKDISLSAAYVGQRVVKAICVGAHEIWSAIKYIVFKDPVVEQICATNWGDGVGITEEQAAAVKDLGTVFKGNIEITSFDELAEFNNVTTIVHSAFSGCTNLTTIKLPRSIKTLYNDAFNGCVKLTRIELNDGLTAIEAAVFLNCSSLASIVIPNSVTKLGGSILRGCSALVEAQIPSFVEGSLYGTFDGCANLSTPIVVPKGVTSISDRVFYGCKKVPSITFEDGSSLRSIGAYAFSGCSLLTSLIIPDGVTSIGRDCFNGCGKLTYIKLPSELVTISPFAFFGAKLASIIIPEKVTSIGEGAFYNIESEYAIIHAVEPPALTNTNAFNKTYPFYVPDQSVTAYREASGWSAYADRIWPMEAYLYGIITFADPAVEAICLANWDTNGSGYLNKEEAKAVTDIGEVFRGNTEITSFNELLDFTGISSVHQSAFANCENLREISIPIVTNLGPACFYHCSRLINIYMYNDTPPYVGHSVFEGTRDAVVYVPDDSIEAYKNADSWKNHARRVLGVSNRDRLITDNYTKNAGQSYGTIGGNITFTTDDTFEWAKIPIGDVESVVVRSTDAIPSSLIQYVDSNGKILHRDATDNPYAVSQYVIDNIEGATHVYVSSAAGTMRIYGKQ